jgi:hypothetical protein
LRPRRGNPLETGKKLRHFGHRAQPTISMKSGQGNRA